MPKKRKTTLSKSQKSKKKKKTTEVLVAADNKMYTKTARILMKLLDKFNVSYIVEDIERMRSDYGDSDKSGFDHSYFYKTVVDSFIQEGGGDHSNLVQAHTRNNFYRDCAIHTIRKINKGYRGTYKCVDLGCGPRLLLGVTFGKEWLRLMTSSSTTLEITGIDAHETFVKKAVRVLCWSVHTKR